MIINNKNPMYMYSHFTIIDHYFVRDTVQKKMISTVTYKEMFKSL